MNRKIWLLILCCSVDALAYEFKQEGWKESDIPTELANPASKVLDKVKSGTDEEFFSNKSSLEREITELNSTQDLDTKGRQQQMKESELLNTLHPDSSSPGMGLHLKDVQNIAESTGKMMKNLVQGLKHHNDIDCIEYQADPAIESNYKLQKVWKTTQHTIEEPFFCEHLRNQYNCEDALELRCLKFGNKAIDIQVINVNHPYRIENGLLKLEYDYSDPTKYDWYHTIYNEKEVKEGVFSTETIYRYRAVPVEGNVQIDFSIPVSPQALNDDSILKLDYQGQILVTLNDQQIFASAGGNALRFTGRYTEIHGFCKDVGLLGISTEKGFLYYPVINNGINDITLKKNDDLNFTIRLKDKLRKGNNTLTIYGVGTGVGKIRFTLGVYEKTCEKWSEPKWNETCVLKSN